MKKVLPIVTVFFAFCAVAGGVSASGGDTVLFVSDRVSPGNYDIYALDVGTGAVKRVTTHSAIDNHPDLYVAPGPLGSTKIVFSSTRKEAKAGAPVTNPEGDFEIFVADWDGVNSVDGAGGNVVQLTSNGLLGGLNEVPDRHPHFSHDGARIIYSSKYECVRTRERTVASQCSVPVTVIPANPCGQNCEGIRIMDAQDLNGDQVGDNLISITSDVLSAANPAVWPYRADTEARYVGHPSFSPDDTKIVFSGAVDGEGRNWEVYVADWNGVAVTSLKRVTLGSTYPPNPNPIKMTGGAHFTHDGTEIILTSTRTALGNSQLFKVLASAVNTPVSPAIRLGTGSDAANDYVPDQMADGRIVVTSDRNTYTGAGGCPPPPPDLTIGGLPNTSHTVTIRGTGTKNPASGGTRVHVDMLVVKPSNTKMQETSGVYTGPWTRTPASSADGGFFKWASGSPTENVVFSFFGTGFDLYLGKSPKSGNAQIQVDLMPPTSFDLYTPQLSTSNDLDLVIIDPTGSNPVNLTENDFADEMSLIGDEVSWFCGLSPNLSLCTYIPKVIKIASLRSMRDSDADPPSLPLNFPKHRLYPLFYSELNTYMSSNNPLRSQNQNYWQQIQSKLSDLQHQYDDELVVLPTPARLHIQNQAPTQPQNPYPNDGATGVADHTFFAWQPSTDPDPPAPPNNVITYDVYLGKTNPPLVIIESDTLNPVANASGLESSTQYFWRVVAKDPMGGMTDGPVWSFTTGTIIAAGCGPFSTPAGGATNQDLSIPAGFFDPGSEPFEGTVVFQGAPLVSDPPNVLGPTDTIVRRNAPINLPGPGGTDTIPIEIIGLSLVSCAPITVRYTPTASALWNVSVSLSSVPPPSGTMTVQAAPTYTNGGTFDATLPVQAKLTFTRVSDGAERILDTGVERLPPIWYSWSGSWLDRDPGFGLVVPPPGTTVGGILLSNFVNFVPGVDPGSNCALGPDYTLRSTAMFGTGAAQRIIAALPSPQSDGDGDFYPDVTDNCPSTPNSFQWDADSDTVGDVCDNCPTVPNPCQEDVCQNTVTVQTIAAAKQQPDGTPVVILEPALVSLASVSEPGCFYMQNRAGVCGIRADSAGFIPEIGDEVLCSGLLGTNSNGERVLKNAMVTLISSGNTVKPWGMSNRTVGGEGYAEASGLSNQALLARAFGNVVEVGAGWARVNDGSNVPSDGSVPGLKIIGLGEPLYLDDFVSVIGVVSSEVVAGQKIRVIRAREGAVPGDVTVHSRTYQVQAMHWGTINGQAFNATGAGTANSGTGQVTINWNLDVPIPNHDPRASFYTLVRQAVGSVVALEVDGGKNLMSLAGGNFSSTAVSVVLTTNLWVQTTGNTITCVGDTTGNYDCTGVTSVLPGAYQWVAGPPGSHQFSHSMFLRLQPAVGTVLQANTWQVTYHLPQDLPPSQPDTPSFFQDRADGSRRVLAVLNPRMCATQITRMELVPGPPPCVPSCPFPVGQVTCLDLCPKTGQGVCPEPGPEEEALVTFCEQGGKCKYWFSWLGCIEPCPPK